MKNFKEYEREVCIGCSPGKKAQKIFEAGK